MASLARCWSKQSLLLCHHGSRRRSRKCSFDWTQGEMQYSNPRRQCLEAPFSTTTKSNTAPSSHTLSFSDLKSRTEHIVSILHSSRNSEPRQTKRLSANHIYDALEGWMEMSLRGHGINAAREARVLLNALENHAKATDRVFYPKESFYDVVLQAFAVCRGRQDAAEASQKIIKSMLDNCRQFERNQRGFPPPEPSAKTFNIAINCWAKSRVLQAGVRAEAVMHTMEAWTEECRTRRAEDPSYPYMGAAVNARTLTGVLDAWSRSNHQKAPERAHALLSSELHLYLTGRYEQPHRLDTAVVNAAVYTWVQSRRGREAATKAEEILNSVLRMELGAEVAPNTRTFSMILDAWARCEAVEKRGDAARRSEHILYNMVRLYRSGLDAKPNAFCFTTCIAAWARCSRISDAPDRASNLAAELAMLYTESGDEDFRPGVEVWNAVLASWCRAIERPESMQRAKEVVEKLKTFSQPDLVTYNTQLDGLGKRGMVQEAQEVLARLESSETELRPDRVSYNSVLSAIAKSKTDGAPEKAEHLLRRMIALGASRTELRPDKVSYTLVIDAWSRAADPRKTLRAQALVKDLIDRYEAGELSLAPDVFVYTVLLKTCAQTHGTREGKQQALQTAFEVFQSMKRYCAPNHMTFSTLMVAINRLSGNENQRMRHLESLFSQCCEAGLVSKQVVTSIQRGLQDQVVLDPEWSRNVPRKDKPERNRD